MTTTFNIRGKLLLLIGLTFIVLFVSCSRQGQNDKALQALREGLDNATQMIVDNNSLIYAALEQKLEDPASHVRAAYWIPKTNLAHQLSDDIIAYTEQLKKKIGKDRSTESKEAMALYQQLLAYKKGLLNIDSQIKHHFDKNLILTTYSFDSIERTPRDFINTFFDQNSVISDLAFLSRFQNNIRLAEQGIIRFCNDQITTARICYFISAIIGQNSSYVKAGEKIEITAGIGTFGMEYKPEITINGETVPLNDRALAVYTLQSPARSGNYTYLLKLIIQIRMGNGSVRSEM